MNEWNLRTIDNQLKLEWAGSNLKLTTAFGVEWEGKDGKCLITSDWIFQDRSEEIVIIEYEDYKVITDQFTHGPLTLLRQVRYLVSDLSMIEVRLIVENVGDEQLRLHRLLPLLVQNETELSINGCQAGDWVFYRNGRQKNDLPSVCVLGKNDEAYQDAVMGLSESGRHDGVETSSVTEVISDELSVIVGSIKPDAQPLLIGFINAVDHLVECRIRTEESRQTFERLDASCLLDGVVLAPGLTREGSWLRLDAALTDGVARFVKAKKRETGSGAHPNPPSVYCTWYYYGDTVSQQDVYSNIEALKQKAIPVDVVQVDEGWEQRFGNWEANHRFPDGMQTVACTIREHGFRPGIWTAPFLVEPRSDMRFYHDDWLLRDKNGDPILFYMNNTDNLVWDVTHPEVQEWIEGLYRKLSEWGYTYHKLDFTRAVANDEDVQYHNPAVTRAEAYRMGVEAVRRGIGSEGYMLICGGLFSAASGLVDAHRTSSDVLSMWSDSDGKQGGKVVPFTIKQNILRYWMSSLWHNDPDALMVRRNHTRFRSLDLSLGKLTDDEARVTALNQYWGGGLVCFSEPMFNMDADRLGLLRHLIPALGNPAVPRDMYKGKQYPQLLDVELDCQLVGLGIWHTVSVVNWNDEPRRASIQLSKELLGSFAEQYPSFHVSEFWSGTMHHGIRTGDYIDLGILPPHSAAHLKIVPVLVDQPTILYTNGHFSMGAAEITRMQIANNYVDLHINWLWDEPLNIVLSTPVGREWVDVHPKEVEWDYNGNDRSIRLIIPSHWEGIVRLNLK